MQRKTGFFNLWTLVHKEEETYPEHAIEFHMRKTICLKYLFTHINLEM